MLRFHFCVEPSRYAKNGGIKKDLYALFRLYSLTVRPKTKTMQVCDDRQAVCAHFHSQLVYGTARPIGNKKAAANATATLILGLLAYPLKDTKKGEGARFPAFCAFPL